MSEDIMKAEDGLTRREMLKKSALVGAVAWTIPIVGSFNAPAFGQATVSPASCTDWTCGQAFDICGDSGPLNRCLCDVDTEGNAYCWEDTFCSDSKDCTDSDGCPAGWRCTTNCCGTTCLPSCGTDHVPGTGVQGAATASGS